MDIHSIVSLITTAPWLALLPLLGLGVADGVLGYLCARTKGEKFSFQRFADFEETSVGAHQIAWIIGAVFMVLLSQGTVAAAATLLALGTTSGVAYAKVLADVIQKGRCLLAKTPGVNPAQPAV